MDWVEAGFHGSFRLVVVLLETLMDAFQGESARGMRGRGEEGEGGERYFEVPSNGVSDLCGHPSECFVGQSFGDGDLETG